MYFSRKILLERAFHYTNPHQTTIPDMIDPITQQQIERIEWTFDVLDNGVDCVTACAGGKNFEARRDILGNVLTAKQIARLGELLDAGAPSVERLEKSSEDPPYLGGFYSESRSLAHKFLSKSGCIKEEDFYDALRKLSE